MRECVRGFCFILSLCVLLRVTRLICHGNAEISVCKWVELQSRSRQEIHTVGKCTFNLESASKRRTTEFEPKSKDPWYPNSVLIPSLAKSGAPCSLYESMSFVVFWKANDQLKHGKYCPRQMLIIWIQEFTIYAVLLIITDSSWIGVISS